MSDSEYDDDVKANVRNTDTWLRGLFMLIYAAIGHLLFAIIWFVVVFQFLAKLITGELNANVKDFSVTLTQYALAIIEYLTFQSDERPWPFNGPPEQS